MLTEPYVQSLLGLQHLLYARNISFSHNTIKSSLAPLARNELAHQFLQSDRTHLLFTYDQRKAELTAGRDEVPPAEVAQGYLSELENLQKRGASDTLAALAAVLDVPVDWLA
jgi:hypothetical protein